jgi:hypothetical protein
LKQARHRASRLFSKDGARSSLPQYLQISFSAVDSDRDNRGDRDETFLVFEDSAAFGLAALAFFLADSADASVGAALAGAASRVSLSPTKGPALGLICAFKVESPFRAGS